MIVTFISECQKNSLKLTRGVLDTYAHRIGRRTWQAIMTEQGLQAVRARLSRTARKTTAVACHRARGSRRTELLWIVGNRRLFDEQGNVPTNRTARDLLREHDENDWHFLGILKGVVAIAGLFHDFGKAWKPFQKMLFASKGPRTATPDPIRHEWVSLILFLGFVADKQDAEWLAELAALKSLSPDGRVQLSDRIQHLGRAICMDTPDPFTTHPSPIVRWIAWLVVSHHRLPQLDANQFDGACIYDDNNLLNRIRVSCGYEKPSERPFDMASHWLFEHGLPILSDRWCKAAARWGRKLGDELELFGTERVAELEKSQRLLLSLSRMVLMLGDHEYSSKDHDTAWPQASPLFANTYKADRSRTAANKKRQQAKPRQRLDEHLVRVTDASLKVAHLLPAFETALPTAQDLRPLRKPSPASFAWQNRAVAELRRWQQSHRLEEAGFFAVNMASTGTGKTFANAKIMDAVSPAGLRYSMALGLRTLTLQTGDEYRAKLKLDPSELAVLLGSAVVRLLHEQRPADLGESNSNFTEEHTGAESRWSLSDGYDFDNEDLIPDDVIGTTLRDKKCHQFLKTPILVCTIDHLMPAVEGTRGGRQILPMLRMLSADLIVDEVDDFDHADMPAIARLVHLGGMLGRKVMISSATISPAIAAGLFHAYREGWNQFARFRNRSAVSNCFWTDEFSATTARISDDDEFLAAHEKFVDKRIRKLTKEVAVIRRAAIRPLPVADAAPLELPWFREMAAAAIEMHHHHSQPHLPTGKRASIGIIRVANVDPCIDLARHLLGCDLPDDIDIRVMAYHARQVLLLRSEQERHLDHVLNRKGGRTPFDHPIITHHLLASNKPNVIFVVVATPVAEVGRDHDYDWAVVEPSSMRSIIQMAGRVWRHRSPAKVALFPNVVIPDLNLKAFATPAKIVFNNPGFEGGSQNRGGGYRLATKRVSELVDATALAQRLDASPRIACPAELTELTNLAHLEHRVLRNILIERDLRPAFVRGWTSCGYYLSDVAQRASRFRESFEDAGYKLHLDDNGELVFRHVDPSNGQSDGPLGKQVAHVHLETLPQSLQQRLWFAVDYAEQIERQQQRLDRNQRQTCELLGEIRLPDRDGQRQFRWSAALGARTFCAD